MELELRHTSLDGFQTILERTVVQEETMEGIVPDICPDMMRIVDAYGQVFLTTRELSAGSLRMTGTVRAAVLYIPEGEEGPRHMEVSLPFVCLLDDPGLHGGCKVWAKPRLNGVDARAINPRKVLTRAEILIDVRVYAPEERRICVGAACSEEIGLQQKLEERETWIISAVNEKAISFSDELSLPSSRPKAAEILCSRVEQRGLECKVIGGKLVVKGEAELIVLYRTEEGSAAAVRFALPYSQVMELPGVGEESEIQTEATTTGLVCTLTQGDCVSITVEMLIQAAALEKRSMTVLTDLYATACPVEPEREQFTVCDSVERGGRRESVRQFCECGIPAGTVVDSFLSVGRMNVERGENGLVCQADTSVTVLFLSEDGALCSATYPIPARLEMRGGETGGGEYRCRAVGELTAVPVTGGLEVRFEVEFSGLTMVESTCPVVGAVRVLPLPEGGGERPSVILRMVGDGESLWDVAKAYQSTIEDIAAANELEDEQIPQGGIMLLIPRRR